MKPVKSQCACVIFLVLWSPSKRGAGGRGKWGGRLQLAYLITCKTFKAQVSVQILSLNSSYEANSPQTLP